MNRVILLNANKPNPNNPDCMSDEALEAHGREVAFRVQKWIDIGKDYLIQTADYADWVTEMIDVISSIKIQPEGDKQPVRRKLISMQNSLLRSLEDEIVKAPMTDFRKHLANTEKTFKEALALNQHEQALALYKINHEWDDSSFREINLLPDSLFQDMDQFMNRMTQERDMIENDRDSNEPVFH